MKWVQNLKTFSEKQTISFRASTSSVGNSKPLKICDSFGERVPVYRLNLSCSIWNSGLVLSPLRHWNFPARLTEWLSSVAISGTPHWPKYLLAKNEIESDSWKLMLSPQWKLGEADAFKDFCPNSLQSPMTINCSHLPTHLRQEVHEWMLRDSRWTHPMDAVRKWRDFSFSCLFSLVSFALLLFYYYMLLCVHFFMLFFKKGGWRMGRIPILWAEAVRNNVGSWYILLLEMSGSSTSCWSLGSKHLDKFTCR